MAQAQLTASAPAVSASALVASTPAASSPTVKAITLVVPASSASFPMSVSEYLIANPVLIGYALAAGVALMVGVLTFSGVVLSLKHAHRRMKEELTAAVEEGSRSREHTRHEATVEREHSRAQAVLERENLRAETAMDRQHAADTTQRNHLTEMRKMVYLKLVDDCMKALAMIGALPGIDLASKPAFVTDMLTELGASVNKTWLVSGVETAFKARELHSQIVQLFMRMMKRMRPLQALKAQIALAQRTRDSAVAERDRLLVALHDNKNFNGNDQQVLAGLMQSKQMQLDIIARADVEIVGSHDKHTSLVKEAGQYGVSQVGDLMKQIQGLMLSARVELGLEGDNEVLRQQTSDMFERAKRSLDDFNKPEDPSPADS